MQLLIIILFVTVLCLWMRGDGQDYPRVRKVTTSSRHDQAQIERLKARVSALESILLDRERKFRDGI